MRGLRLIRAAAVVGGFLGGTLGMARAGQAATIFVAKSGADVNDGLSWAAAKGTVGGGLAAAVEGDQVWVAKGVYVERITLKVGVGLYGGFVGSEGQLGERDWAANVTVLDGNNGGSLVTAPVGAAASTRIDGFTLRKGRGSQGKSYDFGGGIFCLNSSPTIANNTITGNGAKLGGGIYCQASSPTITSNTITNNTNVDFGGGIYCCESSVPTISYNSIAANTVSWDGGGIFCLNSSPVIVNNTITGNKANGYSGSGGRGAGIYCYNSSPLIANNTIAENTASSGYGFGGGICSYRSSPPIRNNRITGNTASSSGGAIYSDSLSLPEVFNNVIERNSANAGGAISCGTAMNIANNTIVANSASYGGGIDCVYSPVISNNIVAFNSSGIRSRSGAPVLRNNCVHNPGGADYSGVSPGSGDILVDPQLVAFEYGQIHLRTGSPCIDVGYDSATQAGWLDWDGETRIQGGHVDIGADEYDGAPPPPFAPVIIRVSSSGNNTNDGSTWAASKLTVQAGIDAVAGLGGGEVWVAAGTYRECIALKPWVYAYGGFAGNEESRDDRDWRGQATVLDGGTQGSVVSIVACGRATSIDGFWIQNGKGTGTFDTDRLGGGIYCSLSSPKISNNRIVGNGAVAGGGGIYCADGLPFISNNVITANTAGCNSGGGVFCYGSPVTIVNNTIAGNAALTGGGIFCRGGSQVILNNTIAENTAVDGGGIHCYGSSATISNNTVAFNSTGVFGSGGGTPVLRNNCVYTPAGYSYSGVNPGQGDFSADPRLLGSNYGEFHIGAGSPCINGGDDTAVPADQVDMDGETRIQGTHVDIGADEFNGTTTVLVPKIIRVSPSGSDANDGSNWSLAKATVQAGIDAVAAGGEVWVAAGTYNERISLRSWVYVYGGFAGMEIERSQRDRKVNVTILDGGAGGSTVSAVFCGSATGIDGFTIRGGSGTTNGNKYGGGVYCRYSAPKITSNLIVNNKAEFGGGIYCYSSLPSIWGNTIKGNTATADGGGIGGQHTGIWLLDNIIEGNIASSGAGVWCSDSSGTIINNTIAGNIAVAGAGLCCLYSSLTIANNLVVLNANGIYGDNGTLTLRNNCIFNPRGANYTGVSAGSGDLSIDPRLLDGEHGEVHLAAGSPCIDAGLDSVVLAGSVDMDGEPRLQGAHVDIGADEYDGTTPSYVSPRVRVASWGDDAHDGSTWELAKRTVQAGVDAATTAGGGDVWVAGGVYKEQVTLGMWVHLYGGFEGREADREQRDWVRNVTVIDGDANGSVIAMLSTGCTNRVDGLTITNGSGTLVWGSTRGGGIYCQDASPVIANNRIVGNTAKNGGGFNGLGLLINNAIVGNTASCYGGGLYHGGSGLLVVENCTFSGNVCSCGAVLCYASSSDTLANCILWGNSGKAIVSLSSLPTITHCDVQDGWTGTGNANADPRFVRAPSAGADGAWGTGDDDYGDLRLMAGSPCIDAGSNAAVPAGVTADLDGHGRFYDDPATADCRWAPGTCGTAPIVDMGAFEFIAGDYDRDGDLDANDLLVFQACVSGPGVGYVGDCLKADLDRDGDVDAGDFGIFQRGYSGVGRAATAGCGG